MMSRGGQKVQYQVRWFSQGSVLATRTNRASIFNFMGTFPIVVWSVGRQRALPPAPRFLPWEGLTG